MYCKKRGIEALQQLKSNSNLISLWNLFLRILFRISLFMFVILLRWSGTIHSEGFTKSNKNNSRTFSSADGGEADANGVANDGGWNYGIFSIFSGQNKTGVHSGSMSYFR